MRITQSNLYNYNVNTSPSTTIKIRSVKELSTEQQEFIELVKQGKNVLVDACIGSGKTTAIQSLCNELPNKNILYLTYNTLLKVDAKQKIKSYNVEVTNYHGYAYMYLKKANIPCGITDLLQVFNLKHPPIKTNYDLLVIDEYQDIDLEISEALEYIKENNPNMQIVAVGDMEQKIYDKTSLDVTKFIDNFLGNYEKLKFTQCFRLNSSLAEWLGRIWQKDIKGVNNNCEISLMTLQEVKSFLATQEVEDILCLGARTGNMTWVLNDLETTMPNKFNKRTVYATIKDEDKGNVNSANNCAIFTTFDSSKGMERKVCVVFDFTEDYWEIRLKQPSVKYEILRNIFGVAASRGKEHIIFVNVKGHPMLTEKTLSTPKAVDQSYRPFNISDMFSFKYKEDVEDCFNMLAVKELQPKDRTIEIKHSDGLIDLSPCIGIYQEAMFFNNYDIQLDIQFAQEMSPNRQPIDIKPNATLEEQVLYLVAYKTYYDRYVKQVSLPFVTTNQANLLKDRLFTHFDGNELVQQDCEIALLNNSDIKMKGKVDVLKNDIVYELKFVNELSHENFLQCAVYIVALGLEKGILWNIYDNQMYEITVDNRKEFLKQVVKTITKQAFTNPIFDAKYTKSKLDNLTEKSTKTKSSKKVTPAHSYDAVIKYIKDVKGGFESLANASTNPSTKLNYQKQINVLDMILKEFKEL